LANSTDEFLKMNAEEIKLLLSDKTVGIAGCGGLGSNCAVALARIGIGHLIIVDFDSVDVSNLNRQYYFRHQIGEKKVLALAENIHGIDENIRITAVDTKLDADEIVTVFAGCDVVVEAFDLAGMKQMIAETVIARMPGTPLVMGNGMAGWGFSNRLKVEKPAGNIYVCGDGISEISETLPPLAPRVGIVANMQANTVLNLLLGNTKEDTL
jgi:sulfur carrier protein ThiS adenylyltransferase